MKKLLVWILMLVMLSSMILSHQSYSCKKQHKRKLSIQSENRSAEKIQCRCESSESVKLFQHDHDRAIIETYILHPFSATVKIRKCIHKKAVKNKEKIHKQLARSSIDETSSDSIVV